MNDTDRLIVEFTQAMRSEGVLMADIGNIEARCTTLINRARNERKAESMLPLLGSVLAAERLGVCRRTIYNLAVRARKNKLQEIRIACTNS